MKILRWLRDVWYWLFGLGYVIFGVFMLTLFWDRDVPGVTGWDMLLYFVLLGVLMALYGASQKRLDRAMANLREMSQGRTEDAIQFSEHLQRGGQAKIKRSTVFYEDGSREENISIELDTYEPGLPQPRRNSFGA